MKTRSIRRRKSTRRRRKGGAYKDGIDIENYKVQEFESDDTDDKTVFIWTSDNDRCIMVTYNKTNFKDATLQRVHYSPKCTLDEKMPRGEGTVRMVKFILEFLKQKGVPEITLGDDSTITCADGKEVSLALFSFIRSGQTWYEKHFGFKPYNPILAKEYERIKKELMSNRNPLFPLAELHELQRRPCEYFVDTKVVKDLMSRLGIKKILESDWHLTLKEE